jgi:putative FmdB family regulatory protein
MPIYEYACESCGHVFDVLQKMDADLLRDCPECGKPELKKLLSAPNFRLKGGGWYETDFKKDNQRNLHDDSKPAAKKDKKPDDAGKAKDAKSATTPKSGSSGSKSD